MIFAFAISDCTSVRCSTRSNCQGLILRLYLTFFTILLHALLHQGEINVCRMRVTVLTVCQSIWPSWPDNFMLYWDQCSYDSLETLFPSIVHVVHILSNRRCSLAHCSAASGLGQCKPSGVSVRSEQWHWKYRGPIALGKVFLIFVLIHSNKMAGICS